MAKIFSVITLILGTWLLVALAIVLMPFIIILVAIYFSWLSLSYMWND